MMVSSLQRRCNEMLSVTADRGDRWCSRSGGGPGSIGEIEVETRSANGDDGEVMTLILILLGEMGVGGG